MADTITLKLTGDEIEMLVDALEVDLEGYTQAAQEARMQNNREDLTTFNEASTRIQVLKDKLEALIGD
jgi:hypothetical protein